MPAVSPTGMPLLALGLRSRFIGHATYLCYWALVTLRRNGAAVCSASSGWTGFSRSEGAADFSRWMGGAGHPSGLLPFSRGAGFSRAYSNTTSPAEAG